MAMNKVHSQPQSSPALVFSNKKALASLNFAPPASVHLRDGECVLYRRSNSPVWYCRYKLQDGSWHRTSTRKASLEYAIKAACELYDLSRFRERLGLAHSAPDFAQIAHATLQELRKELDGGVGKSVYYSYITCIEKYFLPYFGDIRVEEISYSAIKEFELWRNRQMGKVPRASTLNNFASAWNKLCGVAVDRGWISERVAIPRLSTRGQKSVARPAFSREEIEKLLVYMVEWSKQGRLAVEREMRPLLRDYVEMLLLTGMRHGTEALGICWKHIEWHTDKEVRYLRIWVNGKTGGRWLIAKHRAIDVLKRLHSRQDDINAIEFEELLKQRTALKLFTFSNGYQPPSLNGTFRRLMRDSGLEKGEDGQNRTLYSLRHTYATLSMVDNNIDIHTLAKQMGTSVTMLERHYSKMTATLAAERLA
jgi:integrase